MKKLPTQHTHFEDNRVSASIPEPGPKKLHILNYSKLKIDRIVRTVVHLGIEDVQVRGAELSLYTHRPAGRLPGRRPAATAAFFLNFASVERICGRTDN